MRILFLLLLILPLALPLKASAFGGVSAFRDADGSLTLTGENCDLLKRHQSALEDWKQFLKETPGKPNKTCTCDSLKCYLTIDSVSPAFVEKYHGVDAGRWGPNCWNSVLVTSKILPVTRFTPPEEMNFWMSSPLCRPVPMDETPEPGDIVAIRHSYIDEVHAFIFVTEELSFSKNFLTTKAPYLLQSSSDVFAIFPVSFSCRHRDGNPGDCQTYANYFRCTSLDEYVQSRKVIVPTRYSELETIVREQELIVSKIEFEWKTNLPLQQASPQLLKEAQAVLTRIKREVNSNAEAISSTPDQRLLWSGLKFRIIGTLMSIDWI